MLNLVELKNPLTKVRSILTFVNEKLKLYFVENKKCNLHDF